MNKLKEIARSIGAEAAKGSSYVLAAYTWAGGLVKDNYPRSTALAVAVLVIGFAVSASLKKGRKNGVASTGVTVPNSSSSKS